jgi:hypothetical protein
VLLVAFLGFGCLDGRGEERKAANPIAAGRIVGTLPLATSRPRLSLDGEWSLRYDPGYTLATTKSFSQKWYQPEVKFPEVTQVPGCWHYKTGKPCDAYGSVVWFKKTFKISATWNKGRVWLNIGGVKPSADIWLNGTHLGFTLSSRSPIKMDVSDLAKYGEENTLAVCVSYPDVRLDGVWDWGDQVWDGIYRSVFLEQTPDVWIEDVHVQTDVARRTARVNLVIRGGNRAAAARSVRCRLTPWQDNGPAYAGEGQIGRSTGNVILAAVDVDMKGARLWSPDVPNLYVAEVSLLGERGEVVDEASMRFGLREISRKGKQVLLNGRPIFLRGGCDDQLYPESFCPPNSKEFYLNRIKLAKEYGFNYTKSCVEVFTPEFLDAADEAGYLVCEEMPFGLEAKRNIRYNPPPAFEALYRVELAHIVQSDRNHPSVVIYSMCSEIWEFTPVIFRIWGQDLPQLTRQLNPSALLFDCTGGFPPEVRTKFGERITDLESRFDTGRPCNELPYIFHEWHWITALPDLKIKARYRNLLIKPTGVLQMEEAAAKNGLTDELPQMVAASQKLKFVLRKAALEYARKTPGTAGYHHWLIHDINWCPEGVFNEFWEPPADLPAEEFKTYNADTVVLLKNAPSIYENHKACYFGGEQLDSPILVSHYATEPLAGVTLDWTVAHAGKTVLKGHETAGEIACGTCVPLGAVTGRLPVVEKAGTFTIEAFLRKADGSLINRNKWRFWIFPTAVPNLRGKGITTTLAYIKNVYPGVGDFDPARKPQETDLLVTDTLAEDVVRHLEGGGRVLLLNYRWQEDLPDINRLARESKGFSQSGLPDAGAWSTQFRTIPYAGSDVGNMGTVISNHPVLAEFPHEGWCDMQFFRMIQDLASPFDLAALRPAKIKPIIRSNGSYQRMQDKGYVFEAAVGPGKLLASSLALAPADHPERRFLVGLLLKHCSGDQFTPRDRLGPEILRRYLRANNKAK